MEKIIKTDESVSTSDRVKILEPLLIDLESTSIFKTKKGNELLLKRLNSRFSNAAKWLAENETTFMSSVSADSLLKKLKELALDATDSTYSMTVDFVDKFDLVSERFAMALFNERIYKKMRYMTIPFNMFWYFGNKFLYRKMYSPTLFDIEGVHVITGTTGGGKTSLCYELAERNRILFGKSSYVNTRLEFPRFDPDEMIKYVYHKVFDFEEFWSEGKQHKLPNHYKYYGMVIDELLTILDHRHNNTSAYSELFSPFRNYAVLNRHFIKHIYLTTQMDKVDIQLMSITKFVHEVNVNIGTSYFKWLETGDLGSFIKGWWINSYLIDRTTGNRTLYKRWYYQQGFADFKYYNTYSFSDSLDHLPFDN